MRTRSCESTGFFHARGRGGGIGECFGFLGSGGLGSLDSVTEVTQALASGTFGVTGHGAAGADTDFRGLVILRAPGVHLGIRVARLRSVGRSANQWQVHLLGRGRLGVGRRAFLPQR